MNKYEQLKGEGIKLGFVASCWDLMHAGHCLFIQDAKKQCDYLIAGLQTDPPIDRPQKNKPILRMAVLMYILY